MFGFTKTGHSKIFSVANLALQNLPSGSPTLIVPTLTLYRRKGLDRAVAT
jgi:hypothetical protein